MNHEIRWNQALNLLIAEGPQRGRLPAAPLFEGLPGLLPPRKERLLPSGVGEIHLPPPSPALPGAVFSIFFVRRE